jgi:Zn-dependent M32 family carboxypeptidase
MSKDKRLELQAKSMFSMSSRYEKIKDKLSADEVKKYADHMSQCIQAYRNTRPKEEKGVVEAIEKLDKDLMYIRQIESCGKDKISIENMIILFEEIKETLQKES